MKKKIIAFCVLLVSSIPILDAGGCGTTGGGSDSSSIPSQSTGSGPCASYTYTPTCTNSGGEKVDTGMWKQDQQNQQQQQTDQQAQQQAAQQQQQADDQARQRAAQQQADDQARERADQQARQNQSNQ